MTCETCFKKNENNNINKKKQQRYTPTNKT